MTTRLAARQSGVATALVLLSVGLVALAPAIGAVGAVGGPAGSGETGSLDGLEPVGQAGTEADAGLQLGLAENRAGGDGGTAAVGEAGGAAQTATPTNNTTVQHENPDASGGRGDTARLQQWLEGRLAAGIEGSLLELSEGDYELAEGLLSEEWEDRLGQYVEVAGETDSEGDDETADELDETAGTQRNYTRQVREYRETLALLRAAQEDGNQTLVRQYARELEALSGELRQDNATLIDQLEGVQNGTGRDLSGARQTVRNITANITSTQAEITEQTFVRTRLSVSANRSRIAFTRPMRLTGVLRTANGSSVDAGRVTVRVGPREYSVQPGADGEFTLSYRPVAVATGDANLSVRYVPDATSPYLGNRSAVPVTVAQVSPEITVSGLQGPLRFGDDVDAQVRITVDGRPVGGVPTRLELPGSILDRASTSADGQAQLSGALPVALPAGQQSVRASIPWEGRAIASATSSTQVEVRETETELALSAASQPDGGVVVTGTLQTAAGPAVPNQEISITVGDGAERTVSTGRNGSFQTAISATALREQEENASVAIVGSFAGTGTNLAPSQHSVSVEVPAARGADGGSGDTLLPVALGLGVLILGGLGIWWVRRGESDQRGPEPPAETADVPAATAGPAPSSFLLERARSLLESDDREGSVAEAYAAVRQDLTSRHDLPQNLTHREFETACREVLGEPDADRFAVLADAYEQLVFAGDVASERAQRALEAAEAVVDAAPEAD